jgi:ribosomal protein S14
MSSSEIRIVEPCERCGGERPHQVRIEIRPESSSGDTEPFSKEPYRTTVCTDCGREETVRASFS